MNNMQNEEQSEERQYYLPRNGVKGYEDFVGWIHEMIDKGQGSWLSHGLDGMSSGPLANYLKECVGDTLSNPIPNPPNFTLGDTSYVLNKRIIPLPSWALIFKSAVHKKTHALRSPTTDEVLAILDEIDPVIRKVQ